MTSLFEVGDLVRFLNSSKGTREGKVRCTNGSMVTVDFSAESSGIFPEECLALVTPSRWREHDVVLQHRFGIGVIKKVSPHGVAYVPLQSGGFWLRNPFDPRNKTRLLSRMASSSTTVPVFNGCPRLEVGVHVNFSRFCLEERSMDTRWLVREVSCLGIRLEYASCKMYVPNREWHTLQLAEKPKSVCPDCNGQKVYRPLWAPEEPCSTCAGAGEV